MSFSLPYLVCNTLHIQSEEMNGFDNFIMQLYNYSEEID